MLERARAGRLTRSQHVLFTLGELIAVAEGTGSLVRRAVAAAEGRLHEKASRHAPGVGPARDGRPSVMPRASWPAGGS